MARYDVEGKVILVTGAAHGIGLESARRLAEKGARLALVDRDADGVERAANEIGSAAEPFVADVAERESILGAIAAARERFGPIDVALASAGVSGTPTPSTHLTHDEFERIIEINLLGVWRTLHAVLPDVIERRGYLLPIASLAAALPTPAIAAYGASKAGVHSLGRTLRFELAHTGAKVGVAYFSLIDTNMVREAFEQPMVQRSLRAIPGPLGRPVPAPDAAAAIVRGIERRSKRVCVPRWVSPVVSLNGLGGWLESLAARDPRFVGSLRKAQKERTEADHEAEVVPK